MAADHTTAIFAAELILLLFFGRLIGEGMARIGQPAIFGQLLAGVLLGPSIFGAVLPELRHIVFPETPALKSMIDAVSQIGILLLLLLTGMETNLALVNRKRRAVISTSLFGIAVPFVCGVALAYALPAELVPSSATRLVTALFLGTALSISSVKIVGMVLMEIGAIRRDLGQLILATAILDDSLAWIIIAIISGIATYGAVNFEHVSLSIGLTALFLAAMFCAPLVAAIPAYATAPALILVGALMCGAVARVRWGDFSEAFPAFLTLVATPLTFSIATGLSLGLLSFTFLKVGSGKYREISPLIWVLSVLFLCRYAFLGAE